PKPRKLIGLVEGIWLARHHEARIRCERRVDQRALSLPCAAHRSLFRSPRHPDGPGYLRRAARHGPDQLPVVTFEHAFADLGGIPANRLTDAQGLTGLLLAAANAAGLNPASAPVVQVGPRGLAA